MSDGSEIEWDAIEADIAEVIAEYATIAYELRPDGLVDPKTICMAAGIAAAHMVVHRIRGLFDGAMAPVRQ